MTLSPIATAIQEETKCALLNITTKLMHLPVAVPFNAPVDMIRYPKYCSKIKHPIDLGTIKSKLESDQYDGPFEFIEDMELLFQNARTFNAKKSSVYACCEMVSLPIYSYGPITNQL